MTPPLIRTIMHRQVSTKQPMVTGTLPSSEDFAAVQHLPTLLTKNSLFTQGGEGCMYLLHLVYMGEERDLLSGTCLLALRGKPFATEKGHHASNSVKSGDNSTSS